MCDDHIVRRFAGVFILLSLALGWWVNPGWFLFTAFCPLERFLARCGLRGCTREPTSLAEHERAA